MNMRVEEDDDKGAVEGGARRGHTKRVAARLGLKADHTFDYKDIGTLKYFITDRGKIVPVRVSGLSARLQVSLALSITRESDIALLPYSVAG
jgi:small subunit ribosomal protein S18